MKIVTVKTQAEMNALPLSFDEWTEIHIKSDTTFWLKVTKTYQNAQVTAYDSSQVRAYGSSQVTAYDSSQVRAYGSSQVTACDSSQVRAYGSSQVTAYGNSMIAVLSAMVVMQKIAQYAIIALDGVKIKLPKKPKTVTVIKRKLVEHDINSFIDCWNLTVEDDSVILYKTVRKDTLCDFRTGKIKYEGIVSCPDFDSSKDRECGGGLHLCATGLGAIRFADGAYKLLKCRVKLKDIVVYGKNIEKVRCRQVEVLSEA